MISNLDLAEYIVAAWLLGDGGERLPTGYGVLDRALKVAVDRGDLPRWLSDSLEFIETRTGIECLAVPELLSKATELQLISDPNPSYVESRIRVTPLYARTLIRKLGRDPKEAEKVGRSLHAAMQEVASRP